MRQNPPVKLVISDEFYQAGAKRNAAINADRAAQGLPPVPWEPSYISESQARAEDAERKNHSAANVAPPQLARRRLTRAAKTKLTERNAAIPGFDRHSRKCQICRSPYVDHIEQVYLQWERVDLICRYFQLADTDTVYRHARAAGLDVLRRQNSRWVVEQFIEQWRSVKISSSTVIRSIRALSCLDEKGRWTDLPKTHILVRATDAPPEPENESLPPDTLQTQDDDVSLSLERTSHRQDNVPLSSERSEPHHGRDSGLPDEVVTSCTGLPEMGPAALLVPSTERSEPHKNSSAGQTKGSFSDLEPPASSIELPEPNRVSMGN